MTDAGAELVGVVDSLGRWAETWVEVLPEHTDPGFALWAWCRVQLNCDSLPAGRVVVHFECSRQWADHRHRQSLTRPSLPHLEYADADPGLSGTGSSGVGATAVLGILS